MGIDNEPMLRWFPYNSAGPHEFGDEFGDLARMIVAHLPRTPERTVALRKLLEARDAVVRCAEEEQKS